MFMNWTELHFSGVKLEVIQSVMHVFCIYGVLPKIMQFSVCVNWFGCRVKVGLYYCSQTHLDSDRNKQPEPPSGVNSCVLFCFIACLIFVCLIGVLGFQQPTLVLDLFEENPHPTPPSLTPEAIRVLNLIMASMTGPYLCDRDFKGLAGLMYSTPQFFLTSLHGP